MMCVKHPVTGKLRYFFDKCLPFGSSISCSHFQRFSNALRHIHEFQVGIFGTCPNYLDDFLFMALCAIQCNRLMQSFLDLCAEIGVPISLEKMSWANTIFEFLGILLDGKNKVLVVPEQKCIKALNMLQCMQDKKSATVQGLQQLAVLLNFLNRAIVPGCAFTRRMYAKFSNFVKIGSKVSIHQEKDRTELLSSVKQKYLKPHHHV